MALYWKGMPCFLFYDGELKEINHAAHAPQRWVKISVSPEVVTLDREKTQRFTAEVEVSHPGEMAETYKWSMTGNASPQTTLSTAGLLYLSMDEIALSKIMVRATSDEDPGVYAEAEVTVSNMLQPGIISVTVTPNPFPATGNVNFTVNVQSQAGASIAVMWSRSGNNHQNTVISATGVLSRHNQDNNNPNLRVRATSTFDGTKYGEARPAVTETEETDEPEEPNETGGAA